MAFPFFFSDLPRTLFEPVAEARVEGSWAEAGSSEQSSRVWCIPDQEADLVAAEDKPLKGRGFPRFHSCFLPSCLT